jgi:hypothetical protein
VADGESSNPISVVSGRQTKTRCYCWQKASTVVKCMRNSINEKISIMNQNSAESAFQDMERYPEIKAPETVKQLAKSHAKFLVSIHHLTSISKQPSHDGAPTKEESSDRDKQDSQIPQLHEKSWPMYCIDNIRIRNICDVSTYFQTCPRHLFAPTTTHPLPPPVSPPISRFLSHLLFLLPTPVFSRAFPRHYIFLFLCVGCVPFGFPDPRFPPHPAY